MRLKHIRLGAALMATVLLVAACTSGSSSGGSSATSAPSATGPAPGVTHGTIKVGVTYVDTASLVASGLHYNLGDYKAAYQALFDNINAHGGIHGRKIVPVYAPINPTSSAPAEAQCVKLTEDQNVFIVAGFFLNEAVLCPVESHATAVVDGTMTPERTARAKAPWLTWLPDGDQPSAVLTAMKAHGALDGKVGVYAGITGDSDAVNHQVVPALHHLGVNVVDTGVVSAPQSDTAAVQSQTQTIAERFKSSGVDTVVIVGSAGQDWPTAMASNTSYRPKLVFIDQIAPHAFASNAATTDTSVLDGSLAGGSYGPDQAKYEEPKMQACIRILKAAGVHVPAPKDSGSDPSNQPYQAAFYACPDVALLQAWLQAAGPNLNYGTLAAATHGLKVTIPGDPEERTYGPAPHSDGDPKAYVFEWNKAKQTYERVNDSSGSGGSGGSSSGN